MFSTASIALTRISWDLTRKALQAYSVDVYDLSHFGTSFDIPVGNYTGATRDFQYTSLFVRAAYNSTSVSIDIDNNGTTDTTVTLQEGESFFQNGNIRAGASVTSSLPVGVDVFFGDSVSCFNAKELNVLPAAYYGDTYYTPVPTTRSTDSAVVMFYNPLSQSITISWSTSATSGSFVIPGQSPYRFPLGANGYKFRSVGGESYVANELIDAWNPDNTGSAGDYDWSFALIPENRMTSFGSIAWGPGSDDGTQNANPVWVMPTAATTIYVKWDGNIIGSSGSTSPCGLKYDSSYVLTALQVKKLFDVDKDQSGLAVYNCSSVKLSMAYGEDPISATSVSSPFIDVGTSIQPFCSSKLTLANDDYATTVTGSPVTITVASNDTVFMGVLDRTTVSTSGFLQPSHGTVTVNTNGTILYRPTSGFIGMDTFVYQICSTTSAVCDWATVIIKVSPCAANSKKNNISGQVFVDVNKDGVNNDLNTGISGVKVYLYTDGNCNSTIDANELSDSVTTDASGTYLFASYPQKTIRDDFESGSTRSCANGTDGNTGWLTDWVDAGDGSSVGYCVTTSTVANTDADVIKDGSFGHALRLKDNNVSVTRTFNMSGATSAYLSFSYRRKGTTWIAGEADSIQLFHKRNNFYNNLYDLRTRECF